MRRLLVTVVIGAVLGACGGSEPDGQSTTGAPSPTTQASGSTTASVSTTEGGAPTIDLSEVRADLPAPCTFVDADAMGDILGTEVTANEEFGTDCFYEPVGGAAAGMSVQTSLAAWTESECSSVLQTAPILPGETVEPAPEYGANASLIVTDSRAVYEVCAEGAWISVQVSAAVDSARDDMVTAAAEIVERIIARL